MPILQDRVITKMTILEVTIPPDQRPVTSRPPYNISRPVTSWPSYNRPTAKPPYRPQTTERSYVAEDSWNNEGSGFDDDEGDSWDDEDPFGMDDEEDDDGWGNFGRK